jgi:hypothetical protein
LRAVRPRTSTVAARAGAAFDQSADVGVAVVEVRLIAARFPLRHRSPLHFAEARRAELYAAIGTGAVELHFELELEILRLTGGVEEIDRPGRRLRL